MREAEAAQNARTVAAIECLVGASPDGWYCSDGPRLHTRAPLVAQGGFLYGSDAHNDAWPYWTEVSGTPHLVVPYALACNDAQFLRGAIATGDEFYAYLKDSFDLLRVEGLGRPKMMSVGLHLRVAGHPGRAAGLRRFLDHGAPHDDVWICRRSDIARHWHRTHPPSPDRQHAPQQRTEDHETVFDCRSAATVLTGIAQAPPAPVMARPDSRAMTRPRKG